MRNLILTAIASAALGCAAGYALAPDRGSDASTAVVADGGPPGAFAGRGPAGRGQRGPGAAGPGRSRRPATGFDLADPERSLAHMSVELSLADTQQQAIRDVMQEYRRRMRELHEAVLAELTTEQREKLRAVEAAGSAGRSAEPGSRGKPPGTIRRHEEAPED